VHRDPKAPGVAAVAGREQLHARVVLVDERHVDSIGVHAPTVDDVFVGDAFRPGT
jgi:hypothetical protein